jgi:Domain of unknown function (DUF4205)
MDVRDVVPPAGAAAAAAGRTTEDGVNNFTAGAAEAATPRTMLDVVAQSHLPWGLVQQHGGPCGVLAAVQAEMLRSLVFVDDGGGKDTRHLLEAEDLTSDRIDRAYARALSVLLARAALTPSVVSAEATQQRLQQNRTVRIVLPKKNDEDSTWKDWTLHVVCITPPAPETSQPKPSLQQDLATQIRTLSGVIEIFLCDVVGLQGVGVPPLDYFRRPGGVMLLVLSLCLSRTMETIQEEFDDPISTRLTGQFGHCGQELINLLLTGQATSNVFDNTLSPSGDMVCRGVQLRPAIGYLSQLEAMRYCEVGGYYKSPLYPIWVVGSQSHFTVLFGGPAALSESKSDMLLDECRRAFKAVEGGEENGFIKNDQLGAVLQALNIHLGSDSIDESSKLQTLIAFLEVGGAGIILWDDFWKVCSRLMTGASLETVLQGGDGTSSMNPIILEDGPIPMLTDFAANPNMDVKPAAAPVPPRVETDEELARRLGAEWGTDGRTSGMEALTAAAGSVSPMEFDNQGLTDEQLARKWQDIYDNDTSVVNSGTNGSSSIAATNGSPIPESYLSTPSVTPTQPMDTVEEEEDSKPAAVTDGKNILPFEQYGETFSLYHYNGLRGGLLTPLRITRLTAEEAVGASIALNRGAGGSSHGSTGSQDLEDVLRTKWPSCAINWLGNQPPFID